MSASWPGNMRGPRVKTPLLLLLLLTTALLRTVSCQDEDGDDPQDETIEEAPLEGEETPEDGDTVTTEPSLVLDPDSSSTAEPSSSSSSTTQSPGDFSDDHGSGEDTKSRSFNVYGGMPDPEEGSADDGSGTTVTPAPFDEELGLIIIVIPVVLVVVIIAVICGIFMHRRWNKKARTPDVHREDPYLEGSSTEKVPMPMFEEDVPSVLELEMDELDQWMKQDGESADDSKHA